MPDPRVVLAVVGLALLAAVPAGRAWVIAGEPWPPPSISVWNTTAYTTPVDEAMRAWNAAGAEIRLVPAARRSGADVVFVYGAPRGQGTSLVGHVRGQSRIALARNLEQRAAAGLAAHELGHVLGLGHEASTCAVMAPTVVVGPGSRCGIAGCKALWRCLVLPDDRAGVVALYGRRGEG